MKLKILLSLSFLFIAVFAFSLGLNSSGWAGEEPPLNCGETQSEENCCRVDDVAGVWWYYYDQYGHKVWVCDCQGFPVGGGLYTNRCECVLGCGQPH